MAIAASTLAYIMILPILYLFSQILVPSFDVEFEKKGKYLLRITAYEKQNKLKASVNRSRVSKKVTVFMDNTNSEEHRRYLYKWNNPTLQRLTCRRFFIRLYKLFGMIVALDWYYLLTTYSFGYFLLGMIRKFISSIKEMANKYGEDMSKSLLDITDLDAIVEEMPKRPRTFALGSFFNGREKLVDHDRCLHLMIFLTNYRNLLILPSNGIPRLREEEYRWTITKFEFPTYFHLAETVKYDFDENNVTPKDPLGGHKVPAFGSYDSKQYVPLSDR